MTNEKGEMVFCYSTVPLTESNNQIAYDKLPPQRH